MANSFDPPAQARQHLEQAYTYEENTEFKNALRECELALQLAPDWADAHNLRGIVPDESSQKEAAITAHRQAIRLNPALREARENLIEVKAELERTKSTKTEHGGARWQAEKKTASRTGPPNLRRRALADRDILRRYNHGENQIKILGLRRPDRWGAAISRRLRGDCRLSRAAGRFLRILWR